MEARVTQEQKRLDGRELISRIMVGETDDTDGPTLDPSNPDHQAAVDDYFKNIVVPNRGRVRSAATLIAATGMVPKGVNTFLAKALSIPPDLGADPKTGPSPKEQAIVAGLLARIDVAAPDALNGIDPRIRARAELINQLIDSGTAPEQAAMRAEGLMAAGVEDALEGGAGDAALQGGDDGDGIGGDFDPTVVTDAALQAVRDELEDGAPFIIDEGGAAVLDPELSEETKSVLRFIAEVAPGTGEVLSAREAVDSYRAALQALDDGDTAQALLKGGETVINVIGAIPGGGTVIRLGKAGVKRAAKLLDALKARRGGKGADVGIAPAPPRGSAAPGAKLDVTPDPAKQFKVKLPRVSRITNSIPPKTFNKMPKEGFVDPNTIRTAQRNAKRTFQDERTLEQMVHELRTIEGKEGTIKPTLIAVKDGKVFALDHRRLIAHRIAGKKIRYRKATEKELRKAIKDEKFSTTTDGLSIVIKEVE